MSTFVLIHGAWHDGLVWENIAKILSEKGHQVYFPTVLGHGKNTDRNVSHEQCSNSIINFIIENDLNDIVLLGHSYGGTIISKVAEGIPERIKRLIYWNAFVLQDQECMLDNMPEEHADLFKSLAKDSNDNSVSLPFEVWRNSFISDANEHFAKETYARIVPQPFKPFCDKLDLKKFYNLDIPKSYLNCAEDSALPKGFWHPKMSSRLGHFKLVEMRGSHEALFTKPLELADKIIEASV